MSSVNLEASNRLFLDLQLGKSLQDELREQYELNGTLDAQRLIADLGHLLSSQNYLQLKRPIDFTPIANYSIDQPQKEAIYDCGLKILLGKHGQAKETAERLSIKHEVAKLLSVDLESVDDTVLQAMESCTAAQCTASFHLLQKLPLHDRRSEVICDLLYFSKERSLFKKLKERTEQLPAAAHAEYIVCTAALLKNLSIDVEKKARILVEVGTNPDDKQAEICQHIPVAMLNALGKGSKKQFKSDIKKLFKHLQRIPAEERLSLCTNALQLLPLDEVTADRIIATCRCLQEFPQAEHTELCTALVPLLTPLNAACRASVLNYVCYLSDRAERQEIFKYAQVLLQAFNYSAKAVESMAVEDKAKAYKYINFLIKYVKEIPCLERAQFCAQAVSVIRGLTFKNELQGSVFICVLKQLATQDPMRVHNFIQQTTVLLASYPEPKDQSLILTRLVAVPEEELADVILCTQAIFEKLSNYNTSVIFPEDRAEVKPAETAAAMFAAVAQLLPDRRTPICTSITALPEPDRTLLPLYTENLNYPSCLALMQTCATLSDDEHTQLCRQMMAIFEENAYQPVYESDVFARADIFLQCLHAVPVDDRTPEVMGALKKLVLQVVEPHIFVLFLKDIQQIPSEQRGPLLVQTAKYYTTDLSDFVLKQLLMIHWQHRLGQAFQQAYTSVESNPQVAIEERFPLATVLAFVPPAQWTDTIALLHDRTNQAVSSQLRALKILNSIPSDVPTEEDGKKVASCLNILNCIFGIEAYSIARLLKLVQPQNIAKVVNAIAKPGLISLLELTALLPVDTRTFEEIKMYLAAVAKIKDDQNLTERQITRLAYTVAYLPPTLWSSLIAQLDGVMRYDLLLLKIMALLPPADFNNCLDTLEQYYIIDPSENTSKLCWYVLPPQHLQTVIAVFEKPEFSGKQPFTLYDIFTFVLKDESFRGTVYSYLQNQLIAQTTATKKWELVQLIQKNQNLLQLHDEHYLLQQAEIEGILCDPRAQHNPKNPYRIYGELRATLEQEALFAIAPEGSMIEGEMIVWDLEKLRAPAAVQVYTFADLPVELTFATLQDHFKKLEERLQALPGEVQAQVHRYIEQSMGDEKNSASLEKFKKELLDKSFIPSLFVKHAKPTDAVSASTFQLYTILQAMEEADDTLVPGQMLTEREEMLLRLGASVQECDRGQKEGLAKFYNTLPQAVGLGVAAIDEGAESMMCHLVDTGVQETLKYALDDEALLELGDTNVMVQGVHNSTYLKNRYHLQIGFKHKLEFDTHTGVLDNKILAMAATAPKEAVEIIFRYATPEKAHRQVMLVANRIFVQENVAKAEAKQKGMAFKGRSLYSAIDELAQQAKKNITYFIGFRYDETDEYEENPIEQLTPAGALFFIKKRGTLRSAS